MNLIKIGDAHFNLDQLSSIQPGEIRADCQGNPIDPIDGYNLYFVGWIGHVPVFDKPEVEAIKQLIKDHSRRTLGDAGEVAATGPQKASGPVYSGTKPPALESFRVR